MLCLTGLHRGFDRCGERDPQQRQLLTTADIQYPCASLDVPRDPTPPEEVSCIVSVDISPMVSALQLCLVEPTRRTLLARPRRLTSEQLVDEVNLLLIRHRRPLYLYLRVRVQAQLLLQEEGVVSQPG